MMFRSKLRVSVFGLCLFLAIVPHHNGQAAEGGYSNYVPGTYGDFGMALAPTESWTLRNDVYLYDASVNRSVRSGLIETDTDLQFLMNFTTLLYKPDVELFGAVVAAGIFAPIVNLDIDASVTIGNAMARIDDSATGIGDITLIPLMLFWTSGNIHTSFAQFIITPTGDYDVNNAINNGLNYWSFDTNFAFTYLNPDTGREFSANLGHLYNTENDDTNYQTGRELHIDAAFNQYLSESFGIGINAFYLKQVSGDSGSGAILGDFKAEAAGIGASLLWNRKIGAQDVSFIAKWLHEFDAENRLEGDHVMLSFALDW